jgi:hypothetical protein
VCIKADSACAVDAVDMANGEEVRNHRFNPTHVVRPADEPERHRPESS